MVPSFSNSKPQTVLSWLIDDKILLPMSKVHYRGRENDCKLAEGLVTRYGIKCSCCQDTFTLSSFEAHAGTKYNRPSANIYLEDGRSLLKCQMQLKHDFDMRASAKEPCLVKINNDDICSVCHQGGSIILCDGCPSSFHTVCLGLEVCLFQNGKFVLFVFRCYCQNVCTYVLVYMYWAYVHMFLL